MQNVQDDALLVQEICSFIHFIFNKWFYPVSLTDYFLLAPILPLNYPYTVTFDLVSGDLRGGNNKKKKLMKNIM